MTERKPATRARERTGAERRPVVDEAIREIITMVTSGQWRSGVSHAELAERHGVTEHTVSGWATQAHRLIRMCIGDGEEVRTRLIAMLEDIHRRAIGRQAATSEGELYDAPDLRAAVSAVSEQAKLLGLVVQRHEVQMTEQQAREKYEELTGRKWGT